MRGRCYCKSNTAYVRYGAKGIKICKRWDDFLLFKEDMGKGFKPGLQIDRIDNKKGYFPENCRWVTREEQQQNKDVVVKYNINGKEMILREVCKMFGFKYGCLYARLHKSGMSLEVALDTPKFFRIKLTILQRILKWFNL